MNGKHLIWIIPLCLILGCIIGLKMFSGLIDFTMVNLTEKCTEKLQESVIAWNENLTYSGRIFQNGKYCYIDFGLVICPERNITEMINMINME